MGESVDAIEALLADNRCADLIEALTEDGDRPVELAKGRGRPDLADLILEKYLRR